MIACMVAITHRLKQMVLFWFKLEKLSPGADVKAVALGGCFFVD